MISKNTEYQFNVSAALIKRLGEVIVPGTISALMELIKNAYDADADHVHVIISTAPGEGLKRHFAQPNGGFCLVEDNGRGMDWEKVQKSWMNFYYSEKKEARSKGPTEKKRAMVGGQGLGRLGTVHLGECVELFTTSKDSATTSHVAFNWIQFQEQRSLTEVSMFAEQLPKENETGTRILVYPLKNLDSWAQRKREIIEELKLKLLPYIDLDNFRVTVRWNDEVIEVGERTLTRREFQKVKVELVWQKMTPQRVDEVVQFWTENGMLRPGVSATERANQVVMMVRNEQSNQVVGISTAEIVVFKQLNENRFYLYRCVILPGYRFPGLASKLIVETRDALEVYNKSAKLFPCIGMITFVENPRFQQARREAIWRASKMAYIGIDKKGRHIRVYYFKGATI